MLEYVFVLLGLIFVGLFLYTRKKSNPQVKIQQIQQNKVAKKTLGEIQVLYASQTGTAAKMASNFAEEASQFGFTGVVINLKDITHEQFKKNQISVFFMANTGEGEPPQNAVAFMKMLNGKTQLLGQIPKWQNINYCVFGLGDTQYQHFNKIGIDTDSSLQKLGANRISKIGLGDANSSMEDDYIQWKNDIWPKLVEFRQSNPYTSQTTVKVSSNHIKQSSDLVYLSETLPTYANYRFFIDKQQKQKRIIQQQLDFKTKASLLGKFSKVQKIQQKRQNKQYGSSLQLQIHLEDHPFYQTASNLALWPVNDPQIVNDVIKYFNLDPNTQLDVTILDQNKRNKFNFVSPLTVKQLLEEYLDLQFRVTKGILKKLSKFQSKSTQYFLNNSSPKTTDQFKRISQNQKQFYYLFRLIKQFQVKISFEDFVQLSQSMGPRLFTIASCWKAQKNIAIVASLVQNGLISKNFTRNPTMMKAQLRKSSFTPIQKWKKVIFIGAGTGFAPFRGYLQQKQLTIQQGKPYPIISMYFGCKKNNSDYIYKDQIQKWEKQHIINKLHLAFSRETEKKVYVQHLLQQNQQQLSQFMRDPQTAMYICGSLSMGKDVAQVIQKKWQNQLGDFKSVLGKWQQAGKLVKELW